VTSDDRAGHAAHAGHAGHGNQAIGVILIGGASRRMGSPKHALRFASGERLLDRTASTLAEVCATVVTAGAAPPVDSNLAHVSDLRPNCGPLAGIEAVLREFPAAPILVMPCDMPGVTAVILRRLLAAPSANIAVFQRDDDVLPLPMRLAPTALPFVRACLEGVAGPAGKARSLRGLIRDGATSTVPLEASLHSAMANVNTPGDARAWGLSIDG
jgi:molybdopterin-guanine dinucleotide biosynthesis protein A